MDDRQRRLLADAGSACVTRARIKHRGRRRPQLVGTLEGHEFSIVVPLTHLCFHTLTNAICAVRRCAVQIRDRQQGTLDA